MTNEESIWLIVFLFSLKEGYDPEDAASNAHLAVQSIRSIK